MDTFRRELRRSINFRDENRKDFRVFVDFKLWKLFLLFPIQYSSKTFVSMFCNNKELSRLKLALFLKHFQSKCWELKKLRRTFNEKVIPFFLWLLKFQTEQKFNDGESIEIQKLIECKSIEFASNNSSYSIVDEYFSDFPVKISWIVLKHPFEFWVLGQDPFMATLTTLKNIMVIRFWSSIWSLTINSINIHNPPQSNKFSKHFTPQTFQTNPKRWQWLNSGNLHPIMFHPRNEKKKHSINFYKTVLFFYNPINCSGFFPLFSLAATT